MKESYEVGIYQKTSVNTSRVAYPYRRRLDPRVNDITLLANRILASSSRHINKLMLLKRAFDILVASIALVILSPLLILTTVLIKIESQGAVFFTQERIGLNRRRQSRRNSYRRVRYNRRSGGERRKNIQAGRPFKIYKFRTMVEDAERDGPQLACIDDPRITSVGKILRKTRIDEIPQFINVLKGEMSVIGPRPERSFFINKVKSEVPEFPTRLMVKPGITGLAQVEYGYTENIESMKRKLFYDLKYITDLSPFLEARILVKTLLVVISGKGAC